jgi:CheY-like chemotaxis protein
MCTYSNYGYRIAHAGHGTHQEGDGLCTRGGRLIAVQSHHPMNCFDFIFMDSRMPKMNGLVTTAKLREMGFRNTIMGFTGNAMDEDVAEFLAAGVDIVLPKPLKMAHLDCLLRYCTEHGSGTTPLLPFDSEPSVSNAPSGGTSKLAKTNTAQQPPPQRSLASILGIEK